MNQILLCNMIFLSLSNSLAETKMPMWQKPYSVDKNTILLSHLDRGPYARNKANPQKRGKIDKVTWKLKGKFRACLFFDGNSSLSFERLSWVYPARRIEMWIQADKPSIGPVVLYNEVESPGCNTLMLLRKDGTLVYQRWYCGKELDKVVTRKKISFKKWNHIAVEMFEKQNEVKIILNGKQVVKGTAFVPGSTTFFSVGLGYIKEGIKYPGFKGKIDELRVSKIKRKK